MKQNCNIRNKNERKEILFLYLESYELWKVHCWPEELFLLNVLFSDKRKIMSPITFEADITLTYTIKTPCSWQFMT